MCALYFSWRRMVHVRYIKVTCIQPLRLLLLWCTVHAALSDSMEKLGKEKVLLFLGIANQYSTALNSENK